MKLFDKVKVINNNKSYKKDGVEQGMIGRIWSGEIRDNCFLVLFIDPKFNDPKFLWNDESIHTLKDDIIIPIKISDLEVVKEENTTDEQILQDIPKNNPKWWCKVENGYIMNLLGEKKNKIPYNYDS